MFFFFYIKHLVKIKKYFKEAHKWLKKSINTFRTETIIPLGLSTTGGGIKVAPEESVGKIKTLKSNVSGNKKFKL